MIGDHICDPNKGIIRAYNEARDETDNFSSRTLLGSG